ncbi:TRAP transporter small permease subunit [Salinicola salarius]|jgi:TRAP-type mannitol/chloroaromatic compound transport system permease small subunit|uniref:TRAP transporter small permease subunit n=1 Tax=Salinicola salarius TaxID=430457 RepID=UPI000B3F9411|nr:TRAP transporter small permease [Salinicola salarius]
MLSLVSLVDALVRAVRQISRWAARLIGLLLLAVVALVIIEVVSRKLLGHSFEGVQEYAGYVLAILSSWGLSHTLTERAHIRIDVGYSRLPIAARAALDLLSILAVNLVGWMIVIHAWPVFSDSLSNHTTANTPLSTPLWIPQLVWVLGYTWFALSAVMLAIRALLAATQGDSATIHTLIGMGHDADPLEANERDNATAGGKS